MDRDAHAHVAVSGIHHVTAMVGDPQRNLDFYAGILGLKLVKKTVNFDAPDIYHLYYGDDTGRPGTVFTTFPFLADAPKGRKGAGQVTVTSFCAPVSSMDYWFRRLTSMQVDVKEAPERFGEKVLACCDPDDLDVEIVFSDKDSRLGQQRHDIPAEHSLRGFHSVTLSVNEDDPTATLMTDVLGFRETGKEGDRRRFEAGEGGPGCIADILCQPAAAPGIMGPGIVHHVAWQVADDAAQDRMRKRLQAAGMRVTPVIDRNYFHSIYFPSPGRILFEVATNGPGFLIDEDMDALGAHLKLPAWLEGQRSILENTLPELTFPDRKRE